MASLREGTGVNEGEGPIVRDAAVSDAAAISALQVRSWRTAYRGLLPDGFLDELAEDAWFDRWHEGLSQTPRAGVHQLVSIDVSDGTPRAIAACGPAREPMGPATAELYLLYTDPVAWRRGHGSALLRETHVRLAEDGHDSALLWVAAGNERSIDFYEGRGWRRDAATKREEVSGATFDEVRMVRDLT